MAGSPLGKANDLSVSPDDLSTETPSSSLHTVLFMCRENAPENSGNNEDHQGLVWGPSTCRVATESSGQWPLGSTVRAQEGWPHEMGNGDGTWAHNFHFLRRGFSWTSGEQQLKAAQEFKSHLAKVGNRWPRLTRPLTAGGDRSEQPHWETLHWGHHRPGDR